MYRSGTVLRDQCCGGIVLIPIRIRLTIFMPVRIRIQPQDFTHVRNSEAIRIRQNDADPIGWDSQYRRNLQFIDCIPVYLEHSYGC